MMRAAVFLDRDDTLIEARSLPAPAPPAAPGDVCDPALVSLLPGALKACRLLKSAGFLLIVVSNQGVVARGGATRERVEEVNARMRELLVDEAGRGLVDAVYYCPYHPKGTVKEFVREHRWRKPAPGMILSAAAAWKVNLADSWVVGDSERDMEAGKAAGVPAAQCLLVGVHGKLAGVLSAAEVIAAESSESVEE